MFWSVFGIGCQVWFSLGLLGLSLGFRLLAEYPTSSLIGGETMEEFLQLLQNNCPFLHTLDLSESLLDNECCNILGEMPSLNILHLNHCAKLESAGVSHLLLKLKSLTRIDALRGKSSNVQNALDSLSNSKTENNNIGRREFNLTHMIFRDPHGIPKVAPICPKIKDIKVMYNVFEYNYDASVDKCLAHLDLFPEFIQGRDVTAIYKNVKRYQSLNFLPRELFIIKIKF